MRQNWAGNQTCRPAQVHQPRHEEEVVALVRRVRARGDRLRVIGAGHSWTDVAMTDGHLVNLDRMDGLINVDRETNRVTVQAGIRLRALIERLATYGLAMENLGSIAEQSVAGVISTGTHGTGLRFKNIASRIVGMRIVTGTGSVLVIDEATGDDLLNASRVALGCLGIITEVTIQVVEAFNLEERSWPLSFDRAVRELPTLIGREEHLKYWWLPHTGKVQVFAYNRTTKPATPRSRFADALDRWVNEVAFQGVLNLTRRRHGLTPALNTLIGKGYFGTSQRVARSDACFTVAMPPRHLELEYAIPVADAPEMLDRTRALIREQRLHVNFVQELRFAAADDAWMSPAYDRDTCHFGAYMGETTQVTEYFRGVERMALEYGGRPHWGKIFYADGPTVLRSLAMAPAFEALARDLDPDRIFVNRFIERLFGQPR